MNCLRNMKIRTKMLVSFALLIALFMAIAALGAKQMANVGDDYALVIRHPLSLEREQREFRSEFRNLRRLVAAMAFYSDRDMADRESRLDEIRAAHALADAHLEQAKVIISGNPKLTPGEREVRLESRDELAELFIRYSNDVIYPLLEAAGANDSGAVVDIFTNTRDSAMAVMDKIEDIIDLAALTADNQIRQVEDDAKATIILMLTLSAFAMAAAMGVALCMSNYIGKSLAPLTEFMHHAATEGDIAFRPEWIGVIDKVGRNKDELGRAIVASAAFFGRVVKIGNVLDNISNGDLTSELPLLSNRDSIGLALRRMQDNLNSMCGEIDASSFQVASGASQVTGSAQSLASGATEQAASIEELSDAIAEITERTRHTANMAGQAADLAKTVKDTAEKGRSRMAEMLAVSGQIREASEGIRKIIKTIDEIAFQTNILAVNASVEAAHAGKYGKGFSVVAAAVRRLAMKSAEAAKDTERLIANSLEKAGMGVDIAGEASASLTEILSGISENSRLVSQIAKFSEEQSLTIEQINTGIYQVSNVVRQNSVTAEESAAASEEMCGQAAWLRELASRFTLKPDALEGGRGETLPALSGNRSYPQLQS